MKQTLLEMVQDILSDMTSDEVNSIGDTVESMQVAQIIKSTYYDLAVLRDWPVQERLVQLTPLADTTRPTILKIPDEIIKIKSINYDKHDSTETKKRYLPVTYLDKEDFLTLINDRDSTLSTVDTCPSIHQNVDLLILNDTAPTYYTSFDEQYIVFDSYDSAIDTTIQNDKMQVIAIGEDTWQMNDNFVPAISGKQFPYLLAEAKSTCFARIKQAPDPKSEQSSNRHRARLSREKFIVDGGVKYPNYGRKP